MSDLCDERYFEYGSIAEGTIFGGELHLTITDEDGDTLAELDTDGVVLWIDEAELAAFIAKMIADHGGLEQYIPALKEAA